MIIWGGHGIYDVQGPYFNTGGRYDPRHRQLGNYQHRRRADMVDIGHTAVWTGNELIIWGGENLFHTSSSIGGRYCAPESLQTQLGNIRTRAFVQTGDNVVIGGFIVQGAGTKRLIIRAIGPEPVHLHITFPMQWLIRPWNCTMAAGALIGSNDNWRDTIIGGIITSDQIRDIRTAATPLVTEGNLRLSQICRG